MRKISIMVMMILMSCGQQPQGTQIEYYVEERTSANKDKPEEKEITNEGDAVGEVTSEPLQLLIAEPTPGASTDKLIVRVEIKNPVKDATWSLLFSPSQDLEQPIAIESDMAITQTEVSWDISTLAPGSYYLFANVIAGEKDLTFKIEKPLIIEEEANPTNSKPTLSLQFPLGENVFVVGTPQTIRWEAADPDNDPISFKLEYSANAGTTWTSIAENITEKTYDWPATGLTQGITYRIRVTVTDDKGASATAASPKNFGVALTPMTFAAGFGTLLTQRCGACHNTGGPNQNQFRSNNLNLATIGVAAKQLNIKTRVENNTMPPNNPLTPQQKEILTMWLWDGAK